MTEASTQPSSASPEDCSQASLADGHKPELPADIASLSFEEALAELESIVRAMEDRNTTLDAAISAYERGSQLRRHCEARLREAEARVERIMLSTDGTVTVAPAVVN